VRSFEKAIGVMLGSHGRRDYALSAPDDRADDRAETRRPSIGDRLTRTEDCRLVTGAGCFVADFTMPGMLHAVVLRSPIAAGRIRAIETQAALAVDGVVAIFTASDLAEDGLGGIPWEVCPPGFEQRAAFPGDPAISAPQPVLAAARVRYVGEPVALIVAESNAAALDGAEAILLDLDEEASVVDVRSALARAADAERPPLLFDFRNGDAVLTASLFDTAHTVVSLETHVPRLVAAPIETRGYLAAFDAGTGQWTLVATAGKPHPIRDTIAAHVLHVDPSCIRVVAPDIGGGFGAKNVAHAEAALVLWASRRIGRPVRWISGRVESFLSDMQGRDHLIAAKLATDADGRFLAIQYESCVNLGAYLAPRGVVPCLSGVKVLTGPYRIAAASGRVQAVFTNTVPTCPYRGAGAPETAFVVERLVDMAAHRLGLDAAEIRRRNLLTPIDLPHFSPTGATIHSVDFPSVLESAVGLSRWTERRAAAIPSGTRRRGIGMAFALEGFGTSFEEAAEMLVDASGGIELRIGTKSSGQGHETSYTQVAADALQLAPERITVTQGDTAKIIRGNGTGASRSMTTGGSAILRTAAELIETGKGIAAEMLQCDRAAIVYRAGRFSLLDQPDGPSISLASVAGSRPDGILHVTASFRPLHFSFPGGCHVAEVEVDLDTGSVRVLAYAAVHDAGIVVNPTIVEGQLHGGIAQGIGAALMERCCYDAESGQSVTASFLDYAVPRALDLPSFDIRLHGTPCLSNPLGAKAVGESGTVVAPAAIANAIVDALASLGVAHIDLPATAEQIRLQLARCRGGSAP
jgi:carbon-monoxide dehydrogenase large subunit